MLRINLDISEEMWSWFHLCPSPPTNLDPPSPQEGEDDRALVCEFGALKRGLATMIPGESRRFWISSDVKDWFRGFAANDFCIPVVSHFQSHRSSLFLELVVLTLFDLEFVSQIEMILL